MAYVEDCYVTNLFGTAGSAADDFHDGIDLRTLIGRGLYQVRDGGFKAFNNSAYGWCIEQTFTDTRGRHIAIRLAHLSWRLETSGTHASKGGTKIAETGGVEGAPGAGNSQGPHLHIEVRVNGKLVNPLNEIALVLGVLNGGLEMTKAELRQIVREECDEQVNQARDRTIEDLKEYIRQATAVMLTGYNAPEGWPDNDFWKHQAAHSNKAILSKL